MHQLSLDVTNCPVSRQLLIGWLLKWDTPFHPKLLFFGPWGSILGRLSDHFGDPGVHRDTQQAPWGAGVHFYRFQGAFLEPVRTYFGDMLAFFLWFGVPSWQAVSRSIFLRIWGWLECVNPVAGCAETIVETVVFEWFYFSHLFIQLVSRGVVLGVILGFVGGLGGIYMILCCFGWLHMVLCGFRWISGVPASEVRIPGATSCDP